MVENSLSFIEDALRKNETSLLKQNSQPLEKLKKNSKNANQSNLKDFFDSIPPIYLKRKSEILPNLPLEPGIYSPENK